MTTVVVLSERLDSMAAPLLEKSIEDIIDGDLTVDAASVEHLGGHCLEILISASKTAYETGHTMTVSKPSEKFVEHLGVFGLDLDVFKLAEKAN